MIEGYWDAHENDGDIKRKPKRGSSTKRVKKKEIYEASEK